MSRQMVRVEATHNDGYTTDSYSWDIKDGHIVEGEDDRDTKIRIYEKNELVGIVDICEIDVLEVTEIEDKPAKPEA